jgi:hypothetical protein
MPYRAAKAPSAQEPDFRNPAARALGYGLSFIQILPSPGKGSYDIGGFTASAPTTTAAAPGLSLFHNDEDS